MATIPRETQPRFPLMFRKRARPPTGRPTSLIRGVRGRARCDHQIDEATPKSASPSAIQNVTTRTSRGTPSNPLEPDHEVDPRDRTWLHALVVRVGNRGTRGGVQPRMPRAVLLVAAVCAVAGCGTSSAGSETDSITPVSSMPDTTTTPTTVGLAEHSPTTDIANPAVSTLLVSEGDVVVNDALVPGSWTGARTSVDETSLVLFFIGAAEYEPDQPCTMRYMPVVEETDTEVRVLIRGEHPPATDATIPLACTLEGHPRSVNVDLSNPFGDRTLVALGQPRGVFDGSTLAEPQWLPDGWQAGDESRGPLDPDGTSWIRSWRPDGDGSCSLGTSGLALLEGAPEVVSRLNPPADQAVTGSHDINGTTATETVQANRNITRLAWTVGDRSYVLSSAPACDGDQPPSLDTMLDFARSLDTPTPPRTSVGAPLLEPGQPQMFDLNTHCGVGFLSWRFNGQWWRTAEAGDQINWMPGKWYSPASLSGLSVELLLSADGNTLTVTYNGRSVEYAPTALTPSDLCA